MLGPFTLVAAMLASGPAAAPREASSSPDAGTIGSGIDQSLLPPQFRVSWSPGIPGGIPRDDDPVRPASVWLPPGDPYHGYSVDPALAGQANAAAFTSAAQAAIAAAGAAATPKGRRIVLLKAGTYFVAPQPLPDKGGHVGLYVTVDGVTLRGEGPDRTRLVAGGTIPEYGTVVLFGHRSGYSEADFRVTAVTRDAKQGSRTLVVADGARFTAGDVITIDQVDGPASAVGPVQLNGGFLWFYDAKYFKRQPAYSWEGPGTGAPPISVSDLPGANAAAQKSVPRWRSTMQADEILSVEGNVLTLKDPLLLDFVVSRSPQAWRTVPSDTRSVFLGNRWSGIENIAVAGGNNQWGFPGGNIAFSYMAYAWAKNVEADGARWNPPDPAHPGKDGHNIGLGRCYRCEIRDSYVHESRDENPGGQAYGIVLALGTSASLVENNISVNNNKPLVSIASGGGNVIAYNYVDTAIIWDAPGWQENAIDDSHGAFTHHDLVEGNWAPNIGADSTHGNSGWHTHFRNYCSGRNSTGNVTANAHAVGVDGWTYEHAYLGNVLRGGTVYETNPSSRSGVPIYMLGNNAQGQGGNWDNGFAASHTYRDGNWDSVTRRTMWASGARALPPSLYLESRPAFFGANPWPWVNPLTGTVTTLPAKARFDAHTPNVVP